ncbi:MAG: hypothetical protein ACYDCL_20960 [Myxococcales bacterium]
MVNKNNNSSTPGSSGVVSTPSLPAGVVGTPGSIGVSSITGGSPSGGGSIGGTAAAVAVPLKQPSKAFRKELTAVANGVGTQLPSTTTINVNGQPQSQSSILAALQAVLALYGNVDAAVQSAKSNRLTLEAALPAAHQYLVALKAALVGLFGKGNPVLEAFGFSASKPRQLTSEQKTARAAKAAATRALRGTGGKRQKAQKTFTGTVQVQTTLSGNQAGAGNSPATGSSTTGANSTPAASGTPSVAGAPASGSGTPSSGA